MRTASPPRLWPTLFLRTNCDKQLRYRVLGALYFHGEPRRDLRADVHPQQLDQLTLTVPEGTTLSLNHTMKRSWFKNMYEKRASLLVHREAASSS